MSPVLHQTHSEEEDLPEEEMEEDVEPILEQSGPGTDLGITAVELPLRQEEFVEIDGEEDAAKVKLNEKKVAENNSFVVEIYLFVFIMTQSPSVSSSVSAAE